MQFCNIQFLTSSAVSFYIQDIPEASLSTNQDFMVIKKKQTPDEPLSCTVRHYEININNNNTVSLSSGFGYINV